MRIEDRIVVVKIGGSTLGSGDTTLADLVEWQRRGKSAVVVHGGGKTITAWLARHGLQSRFVRGLRVTDGEALAVVLAVLAGLVNKELVTQVMALGGRALGLAGVDGGLIRAEVREPDLGYVGEVTDVRAEILELALRAGYLPFIAPIGLGTKGQALNINADTVAGDVAAALRADRLIFLTDVAGVLDSTGRLIEHLDAAQVEPLIASGVIDGGMIPKVRACLKVAATGAVAQIVDGRQPGALLAALAGEGRGTTFGPCDVMRDA